MIITTMLIFYIKENKASFIIEQPYYEVKINVNTTTIHEEWVVEDMNTISSVREKGISLVDRLEFFLSTPTETNW